ncbi:MAG TPA: bifunctional (p)ppGpp synthetase/guanosine-3',5'-bis(diphosphate) 3'-pyrophosphohydrolase [Candidatus Faecimorpha stercoravium]|nr:bifunctional (p)ppGpp synthetase/guanosine-3',5'-bis(diphosphate) 3'-pyrophosphohydrolase [Candidatus Faecimorpha stercoravium]
MHSIRRVYFQKGGSFMEELTFPTEEVEKDYHVLIDKIRLYHPTTDLSMVAKAYQVASDAHNGQLRQSGEPYIIHPLKVAIILADLELDLETIEAGLLHDVVEDTKVSKEDIVQQFGAEVAALVDGVTKLKTLTYTTSKEEIQAENYRKMFMAMAKDIRVILIKLADRLHNLQTLEYKSKEKQLEKARETLDIYAPIANRLGISKIKVDLEDLSLKYLEPEAYHNLTQQISHKREEREQIIQEICNELKEKLHQGGIEAVVEGRPKHFFSIYKKMINKHKTLDQIYDLFAVRAIVDSVKDCYGALGIIHDMYTPVPGRFKDYIAMPKSNMYQSLHTTLIGPSGEPFEVQIRTWEMHRTAQYGIAAHWKYKEDMNGVSSKHSQDEKMAWLQKILEWQQNLSDNREFMNVLKQDLDVFQDSVFVFSPKGDVIELPAGSTPIDFAYQIHSAVGNKMVGARVDGRLVTLDYKVKNGERIEIITSQNSKGPSRDWLNIVKTTQAKNKISQWFKKEFKQENIARGKELIEKYAKSKGLMLSEMMKPEWMRIVQKKYGFMDWDSVLAAVGHGGIKEGQVVNRLYEEYRKEHLASTTDEDILRLVPEKEEQAAEDRTQHNSRKGSAIIVKGLHDLAVRFSKCCNPVPGDEIVGYITRGRGVSIHRTDCINIMMLPEEERKRLIEAEWEVSTTEGLTFQGTIQVETEERPGILVEITSIINKEGLTILHLDARVNKNRLTDTFIITMEISSRNQLEQLSNKLMRVQGVHEIIRTSK